MIKKIFLGYVFLVVSGSSSAYELDPSATYPQEAKNWHAYMNNHKSWNTYVEFEKLARKHDEQGNQAFTEMEMHAQAGSAEAQTRLGNLYARVRHDYPTALNWYLKAAAQNYPPGEGRVGEVYLKGRGLLIDYSEAAKWYRKSADHDDPYSAGNLAFLYAKGEGVPQSDIDAVRWYRKAAEQGNPNSEFHLAEAYENGKGVAQDNIQAANWYRKSAEMGNKQALYNLAIRYQRGDGVLQNTVIAIALLGQVPNERIPFDDPYNLDPDGDVSRAVIRTFRQTLSADKLAEADALTSTLLATIKDGREFPF